MSQVDAVPAGSAGTVHWPEGQVGTVELEDTGPLRAGSRTTRTLRYVVGPYGVDDGGGLKLLWTIPTDHGVPQFADPEAADFTVARHTGQARLCARWSTAAHIRPWSKGIVIDVTDGALAPGDTVEVVLGDRGAGGPGHRIQSFAEDTARIRVMVDPFATGRYYDVPGDTATPVIAGPAATLLAIADSEAVTGEPIGVTVRAIDRFGNVANDYRGRVELLIDPARPLAGHVFDETDRGVWATSIRVPQRSGVVRLAVREAGGDLSAEANPTRVTASAPAAALCWGDTQGQTGETVGAGSLAGFFDYAAGPARLDFVTHSANDFQVTRAAYRDVLAMADERTDPGRFVAFAGFEWSGNTPVGGDHNVLFADNGNAPLCRSSHALVDDLDDLDTDRRTVTDLHSELRRRRSNAVTVPHVGGRLANLDLVDPTMSPVLEIVSVHGWFEWFARDALRRGLRVGFVGASDDHTGRPGASWPTLPVFGVRNGLAAVYATELTREAILAALRARHCYATTGERILLSVRSGDHVMGDHWAATAPPALDIDVSGTAGIEAVELLTADGVVAGWRPDAPCSRRRLRISWSGARDRHRRRFQRWDGALTLTGATITEARGWALDHPEHGIVGQDGHRVAWRSNTSGDWDGVVLDLHDIRENAAVRLEVPDATIDIPLATLGDEPRTWPVTPGVDRLVRAQWLPDEPLPHDVHVTLEAPVRPGTNAVFVRVSQDDGHLAWSSPVFVDLPN